MPRDDVSKTNKNKSLDKQVVFQFYAPQADKVELAGTFNDWNPSDNPLERDKKGKWTVKLKLAPGCYEYRFLIDDTWHNDQSPVKCVPNAFGSWNCVIEIT
ncbi:MAG: isoamylase early set domain-containing protein [Candidatus Omnitrophota bacterium]|nr:isoamylase early set domain-containing protein [Candidatus Omnitrophota bacterium]